MMKCFPLQRLSVLQAWCNSPGMCKGRNPDTALAPSGRGRTGPEGSGCSSMGAQFFLLLLPPCFHYLNKLQTHCCFSGKSMSLPLLPLFCCQFGFGLCFRSIFPTVTHFHAAHNCAALPWLTNLFSNLLFSFFLFMLPNKETNSSEESECDDLDPNTSMEVETIILVIIFSQEHVSVLKCLCCKGSWWVCIAHTSVCQFSVSHKKCQFWFCQALNWSLGFFCSGSSEGNSVTSSYCAGGSCSHPQSLLPTSDLIPTIMQMCQLLINVAPFYIKNTPCPGNMHLSCQSGQMLYHNQH